MALFSGSSARRIGLWGYLEALNSAEKGRGILDTAQTGALAALGRGREAIGAGRDQSLAALGQNYDRARTDLSGGFDKAYGELDVLDPYNQAGQNALGMLGNSLGLNGAGGNSAATAAFQAGPGYQWQVDQATDAIARKASALGSLGSGNTQAAIADRASQLANQEYGNWQTNLRGLADRGQQAATTQGTTRTALQGQIGQSLANLGQAQGRDTASVWSDAAGREAGLYGQEAGTYGQFAGLGLSNLWNGTQTGINSITQGQQQANSNVMSGLNFGINALGAGVNLLGLGMGSGFGSSLAKLGQQQPSKYTGVGGGSSIYSSTGGWY